MTAIGVVIARVNSHTQGIDQLKSVMGYLDPEVSKACCKHCGRGLLLLRVRFKGRKEGRKEKLFTPIV